MAHFNHGDDDPVDLPAGSRVLLRDPPNLAVMRAYVWMRRDCGHRLPAADPGPMPHQAVLRAPKAFLATHTCRGDGAGVEALFVALVDPQNDLV